MKIQTGHPVMGNVQDVRGNSVRFINDEGRWLFEVQICKDGTSIQVRGVESHMIGDEIHVNSMTIEPKYSNCVVIRTLPYDRT